MIELELVGVRVELPQNQPIILLKEQSGDRFLPVLIGAVEATAIAFALQGVVTPRPMTHDLIKEMVDTVGVRVERVVVTELRDATFYAELSLASDDGEWVVSSRTSDAIAIAVRTGCAIYADESVMTEAGIQIEDADEDEVEQFKEFLDTVSPEDFKQ